MNDHELISKLKALKSIEPDENWLVFMRERLLSDSPFTVRSLNLYKSETVKSAKMPMDGSNFSKLGLNSFFRLFSNQAAFALSIALFVITSSYFTVNASMASIPGDALYPVKIASEDLAFTVAAEKDKPKIYVEQAGKRLEELDKLSHKLSDVGQQDKVENLVKEYKGRINKANAQFADMKNRSEKLEAARAINRQTEKYPEALEKAANNLSTAVKEKIKSEVVSAISSTEKVNTQALMVIVEADSKDDGIAEKVRAKIDKMEKSSSAAVSSSKTEKTGTSEAETNKPESLKEESGGLKPETKVSAENKPNVLDANNNKSVDQEKASPAIEVLPTNDSSEESGAPTSMAPLNESKTISEPTKQELINRAKESLDNNDLVEAMKSVAQAEEMEDDKIEWKIMPVPAE